MMLSDHGMGESRVSMNLNTLLRLSGYLATKGKEENYGSMKSGTRAFAVETNKIYFNRAGRFPGGGVTEDQAAQITGELMDMLLGTFYSGRRVIKSVYTREVYSGPYSGEGPDLIVIPERGFSLKTGLNDERIFSLDGLTGTHTDDDAFLFLRGENAAGVPEGQSIQDAIAALNSAGGLSL
jgi:predicted AlkP superfamily phosphohydrolase/phosphomutase